MPTVNYLAPGSLQISNMHASIIDACMLLICKSINVLNCLCVRFLFSPRKRGVCVCVCVSVTMHDNQRRF